MSIQIYILSKLMEENNYPYKLKKELSEPIPFDKLGNLTESKLYYHFESLSKQGLVEPREVIKEEHRPDKQVFAITDKGREQLPVKIYELFKKADKVEEMTVGLMFLRYVEKERVVQILEQKLEKMRSKESYLNGIFKQIPAEVAVMEMVEFSHDYFSDMMSKEIFWLDHLIEKLKRNGNHSQL